MLLNFFQENVDQDWIKYCYMITAVTKQDVASDKRNCDRERETEERKGEMLEDTETRRE